MSKSYSIHDLSEFLEPGREFFLACARTAPWGLGKWDEFTDLLDTMRSHIPVPGKRDWIKDIHVLLKQGECRLPHQHREWTAIFYVDPGDPVCAIVVEGERLEPKPGDLIVLEPETMHEVEKSKSEQTRISFAMLVEAENGNV